MSSIALAERRVAPRFVSDGLLVTIRIKGRFGRLEGLAKDFNRHGVAVVLDQPIPKDKTVYVALQSGSVRLENIIGVVHNCVAESDGFRCGVQFRTTSELQFDRQLVEQELTILETRFKAIPKAS
jgi:hypothetical protein